MTVQLKDPDATVDYTVDWSDYLATGETISSSTWSVSSTGVTLGTLSATTNDATAFVSGGTVGEVFRLTNKVVTSGSRTDERSVVIRVEER